MTEHGLFQRLNAAGIALSVEGERLRYRCPLGSLTPEMRKDLEDARAEILYAYHERAAIIEYDGGLPRDEAEREARHGVLRHPRR